MTERTELQRIEEALAAGRLSVADDSGYLHFLYARCPSDGQESPVYRTEKAGEAITRVIFRCSVCSKQFDAKPADMFFR